MPPRLARMSKTQKTFLLSYLESNKFLLQQNKLTPAELPKYNAGWKILAEELNKIEGAQKNVTQWKDALNEFKVNTRRKARLLHIENVGTGGGPKIQKPLTNLEERLLSLLSPIVITGAPGVPEGGIIEEAIENNHETNENEVTQEIVIENYIVDPIPGTSLGDDNIGNVTSNVTVLACGPTNNPRKTSSFKPKGRRQVKRESEFNIIAKNHEKCLHQLAESNNNLADFIRATHNKRIKLSGSAVFNLKF